MKSFRIWRKRQLSRAYGYDVIMPMSPSTLRIERHDPGGLRWWEDLLEVGVNLIFFAATVFAALQIDSTFGVIWSLLGVLLIGVSGTKLRFKILARRPKSVSVRFEPAEIPIELVGRYEKASEEYQAVIAELEQIARNCANHPA